MSESILSKLTQHNSISMYCDTDFKIEFELQARGFWIDWALLEAAIERCSPGPEKDHAKIFAEIYGGPDFNNIEAPTDPCIESFIHNEAFSAFTIQQLRRMYYDGVDGPKEEIELLEQKKNVDKTLLAYQRLYMSSQIFKPLQDALGSIRATPIEVILILILIFFLRSPTFKITKMLKI